MDVAAGGGCGIAPRGGGGGEGWAGPLLAADVPTAPGKPGCGSRPVISCTLTRGHVSAFP